MILTLSTYAKQNNHTIATIAEASGIAYCPTTQSLVVANDEGAFYELSLEGEILSKYTLGDYDLEGVVCHDKTFAFAVEDGALLIVQRDTRQSQYLKLKGKKFKLSKKSGIEGIAYHKGLYYLSIQAKKKKDAKILVVKIKKNHAKVIDIISHGIIDAAGLQYVDKTLYIVSDKKDTLYLYSLKKNKVTRKIKLDKFAQEGITFAGNHVYFADDKGTVKKYTLLELGLNAL